MKKFVLLFIFISLFSCREDLSENLEPSLKSTRQTETVTRDFNLNVAGNSVVASITVIIDSDTEEIVNYYFSQNVYQSTGKTASELDVIFRAEMGDDYFLQENMNKGEHKDCIEECKDKYTNPDGSKIKGRGACKTNCWIDSILRFFENWPF